VRGIGVRPQGLKPQENRGAYAALKAPLFHGTIRVRRDLEASGVALPALVPVESTNWVRFTRR
jgi:hypothetical protein